MEQNTVTFPLFVFERRRDIELEAGFTLAGQMVVDLPPQETELTGDAQQAVSNILSWIMEAEQAGRLPPNAIVVGWRDGGRPPDAVDTDNDEVMAAWARNRLTICVRIVPRDDGLMRIDSDMRRQMNLLDS